MACDEYAGIIGVDPSPFTLRSLRRMATAKQRSDWDRTTSVLAAYMNVHRSGRKGWTPSELNPFRKTEKPVKQAKTPAEIRYALKAFAKIYERK